MTTTMINNKESIARRTRTKRRRPKFLSLRLQLTTSSAEEEESKCEDIAISTVPQLDPENSVDTQDENVDYFFSAADGGAATTLTGLLGGGGGGDEENSRYGGGYGGVESEESNDLVRTAMRRSREREEEERWVQLAEVVEVEGKLGHQEEVTSCAAGVGSNDGVLSLKLDYQEIINAWADKISPLLDSPPQTVPDILRLDDEDDEDDHSTNPPLNYGIMGGGWGGGLWSVPDQNSCYGNSSYQTDQRVGDQEGPEVKMGQREASMLRYKEKRQNRLFSKRIRYQVRKLNAEKRPRMKGRFVKRN